METIDLIVISKSDGGDFTEFMTGLVRFGEIDAISVADMVRKVRNKAMEKSTQIRRLDIFAHGTNTYISLGKDTIHSYTPNKHSAPLVQLKGVFSENGFVVLKVCEIGQAEELIVAIARAVGVPVFANKGGVSPNLNVGWGTWIVAKPDGTIKYMTFFNANERL